MRRLFMGLLSLGLFASAPVHGDDPVFSGPQVGEKLTPFTMTGVFDESADRRSPSSPAALTYRSAR